jgi:AraC-like DNA-binding protein
MVTAGRLQHLTRNKIFVNKSAPYAIYRHQVDGDHINNVHDHDFVELVVISGGTGTHLTPYGDIPLSQEALFVIQPGVWHGYTDCKEMLVNVCAIDCQVFDCELAWMRDNPALNYLLWEVAMKPSYPKAPIHYLLPHQVVRLSRAFYTLQEIEHLQSAPARAQQIGCLTTFLAQMADIIWMKPNMHGGTQKVTLPDIVEESLLLFSENLARDWSITELSARFGLTTPYYIRLFKRAMGEPPLSYLSGMRARRAAELLLYSETPITRIGGDVGWADPGYFARRFRCYFGISPREYRHKYRSLEHT